jgi:hypothetical protein
MKINISSSYTFGFLAPEAVSILQRIQNIMNSNVVSAMNVIFKRIGFAIHKGVAAELVARLLFKILIIYILYIIFHIKLNIYFSKLLFYILFIILIILIFNKK